MLTAATSPTAPVPVFGAPAIARISRCAGAEVATTYPPMTMNAICMVKVIRLQKPLPNASLTAAGDAPLTIAPSATTTTPMATKMKASGNQRSAQAVNATASRANGPSRGAGSRGTAACVFDMSAPPPSAPLVIDRRHLQGL